MDTRVKPAYDEFGQFRGFPLFFVLSKTLGYLLLPTNFLIAMGFVGAILMATRFASLGRKLVMVAVLLLVICGLSPLGKALLGGKVGQKVDITLPMGKRKLKILSLHTVHDLAERQS